MNTLKFILIAIAAVSFATACSPHRAPNQARTTAPAAGDEAPLEEVDGDSAAADETLAESDMRGETSTGDKVAAWVSGNSIPEEAKMATIYFGFDKYSVSPEGRKDLDSIANYAKRDGIYIIGYSDYIGTEEYNMALSDKRAQAVKNYLNDQGSATSAVIQAVGEQFAVQSGTKDEVAADRKVIIVDGNYGK